MLDIRKTCCDNGRRKNSLTFWYFQFWTSGFWCEGSLVFFKNVPWKWLLDTEDFRLRMMRVFSWDVSTEVC